MHFTIEEKFSKVSSLVNFTTHRGDFFFFEVFKRQLADQFKAKRGEQRPLRLRFETEIV